MGQHLHLNAFLYNVGHHEAAWRLPESDPHAATDVRHYQELGRIAERGLLDSIFFADGPSLRDHPARRPVERIDPTLLLTAIAVVTERIGLIATASTTYEEPYNVARRFASLDLVSNGRAAWNMVTTSAEDAAANFGLDAPPDPADRYRRGDEFLHVVRGLWSGWEDDAVLADQAAGVYADPDRIHALDHAGEVFRVRGPLNVGRSPQGHPVVVQAGSSGPGVALAAKYAEAVFTAQRDVGQAREFYADLKARTRAAGRNPDHIKILPGIVPVLGGTEEEAQRLEKALDDALVPQHALEQLSRDSGIPIAELDLDAPLPDHARPVEALSGSRSRYQLTLTLARRENLTVRELLLRLGGGRGHRTVTGTPEQLADTIEEWCTTGAADGFNVMPAVLPSGLEAFVDHVVPILQRRGLFRTEYESTTLRGHYGLPWPEPVGEWRATAAS